MSALTQEEQLDNLKSLSKKYGSAAVSGILVALIAFFGWNYWQKKQLHSAQNETARVQQLMDEAQSLTGDPSAYNKLAPSADTVLKKNLDSVQAIQAELVMSKVAFDQGNYAAAERELKKVQNAKVDDEGLLQLVNLHLAYTQAAQKKYDDALKTLDLIKVQRLKHQQMKHVVIFTLQKMMLLKHAKCTKVHGMPLLRVNKNDKFYKLNSKVLAF
jgi:predicted negative regulator of RcsB-dependent stress response